MIMMIMIIVVIIIIILKLPVSRRILELQFYPGLHT